MKLLNHIKFSLVILSFGFTSTVLAGGATEFSVDGIKVILKTTPKEVISAKLFIEGGTANYTKAQEGIETIALQVAMEGGTVSRSKDKFHMESEKIGAQFSASSSYDYSVLDMTCIKPFWDKSWNLFTDAIMNPAFDANEFALVKEGMIGAAKASESDPDAHLRNLALANVYKGRNYSKIPDGTVASLEKIKVEDAKAYYKKTIGKRRCFLVVVGNITQEDLTAKIRATLSKMPTGTAATKEGRVVITKPATYIEDRDIATNYIRGLMSAPTMASDEGVPMMLAFDILRARYFLELRTKRSLSYAPSAAYARSIVNDPYALIYISTTDPKQSMAVMIDEINKIKANGFEQSELEDKKMGFLTNYYQNQETSSSQSMSLGMAEMNGDFMIEETLTEKVNNVDLKKLNTVFDKYTQAIQWTYLGKQDQVKKEDFIQMKKSDLLQSPY